MANSTEPTACVDRLKVLADATRLAVVESLMAGPQRVGVLMDRLHVEQSLLSHHLKVLREAGLVDTERDGKAVVYRLADYVKTDSAGQAINLGCCRLSFTP